MVDEGGFVWGGHPAWVTAAATVGSYLVVLVVMTALLFGVPYLLFLTL